MHSIDKALEALKQGRFIMVHDDKGREDEIDLVIAAQYIEPPHIAEMRMSAGGLICLALSHGIASSLAIPYMHEILKSQADKYPVFSKLLEGKSPYGDRPSFSISVNHRQTFTGITDNDRALTISKLARICSDIQKDGPTRFGQEFRTPGHIPLLIASEGLLEERMGHTEMCVYLAHMAGITQAVTICEMMDSSTHRALSIDGATLYSKKLDIPIVEATDLKKHARVV